MKTIYLDDRHHTITISDGAYEQFTQIINAHRVCRRCKQPYTDERPMVTENLCLNCLLRKEENSLLTFVGVLSVDSYGTNYTFLDPKGYIHVSSSSSEKVERSECFWLQQVKERAGLGELNPQPYWGFDDLEHKAGTKLLNCFYVQQM